MTRILIVDDSEVEQKLAAGLLLKDPNLSIDFASDGRQAIRKIVEWSPDLIITDLVMPKMDGLGLVKAVRDHAPYIPVILMTAYGNEQIATDALAAGAASYLAKAQRASRLLETVKNVLVRSFVERAQRNLLRHLTDFRCTFQLDNDPHLITAAVNYIQQQLSAIQAVDSAQRIRLGIALEEALNNALYYGNLELDRATIEKARSSNRLDQVIAQRNSAAPYRERKLTLSVAFSQRSSVRMVIADEGPGFDYKVLECESMAERFECGIHRGLTLMSTFVDDVSFNESGNEVTLVKHGENENCVV